MGTAVTIQEMVFGNRGRDCATGVAFTRDPSTGQKVRFGEYLCNAQVSRLPGLMSERGSEAHLRFCSFGLAGRLTQGEDVVAGIRTPLPLVDMQRDFPQAFSQLNDVFEQLEQHFHDMQDVEFTIERSLFSPLHSLPKLFLRLTLGGVPVSLWQRNSSSSRLGLGNGLLQQQ